MTTFSDIEEPVRRLWAKSGEGGGHGLLAHELDVAAVARVILLREPESTRRWIAESLGVEVEAAVAWVSFIAGLHDFGKAIPGFEKKWPDGMAVVARCGLGFSPSSQHFTNHAAASVVLLGPLLERRYPTLRTYWINHVLQAIGAHHGYNLYGKEIDVGFPSDEWERCRQALFDVYANLLAPTQIPQRTSLTQPAVQWLAGLISVADWIGSNADWFPPGERHDCLNSYFADACERAEAALSGIRWHAWRPLAREADKTADTAGLIARMIGRDTKDARPLQREADRLLTGVEGPALLLVEAPMGEGKTELAFLAHLRLQSANRHRGLYVGLPTQATSNALFERTSKFLDAFADGDTPDIQLVHGGASLNETVLHLRGIAGDRGDSVASSAWFTSLRRALLSPYGVGTVDQALFAALNVKHHFVRLMGLANRVVVLDEVHAYDTYTSTLIEMLLRWLKAMGSSVILMSATLPKQRRLDLLEAWNVRVSDVPARPYPRIFLADNRGLRDASFGSRQMPAVDLHPVGECLDDLLAWAVERVAHRGCGAIVVNTVDRAQRLYTGLKQQIGSDVQLILFHARFPADERRERETQVLRLFGKDGERPDRALLIATQVAEQSLDIDFDFMATDLAPVDLILQRLGRLHRHQRDRPPEYRSAKLFVAGLARERLPELKANGWSAVYDAYILGRTWALLSRETALNLPHDIDRLVDAVYDDTVAMPADIGERDRNFIEGAARGKNLGEKKSEQVTAKNVVLDPDDEPQNAYQGRMRGHTEDEGGIGLMNTTRLGPESVTLVPVFAIDGGWSTGGEVFDPAKLVSDSLAKVLYGRQIRTSRVAVVKYLHTQQSMPAFQDHPLLRHLSPLVLVDGQCAMGSLTVRLDQELGLVFDSDDKQ